MNKTYQFNKTELYETLINTSVDCMLVADEDGLITFTTPQIKELFGWESEEIIGKPVEILIPENLADEHVNHRHSLKTNPHTRPMGTSLNIYAKRKNNTEFPVDIKLNFFKEKGKTFYLAVIRDITDRKKVEERYKILSNLTSDFAYSLGILPDGSFLREWVTDAFESITGYSENELDKKEVLFSIILSEDKHILDAHIEHVLRKEKSIVEFRIKKKDGSIIYVEDYRYPVIKKETGEVAHIYGAIRDITEKKEKELELIKAKEKAEEVNKIKTKFYANMSHELRTPLVGILGFSEIIKNEDENEEFKEYGAMIYASTLRLQRTLNSVLDFSKIDDRSFKLEFDKIDVNKLAKEEFYLFKVDAEKKQIDYKLNLKEDTFIIKSDSRLLSTIFNHIIDNGIKYTKEGFVEVNVNKAQEADGTFLLFEVKDSGIGIEKEQLNLIWEEFRQVSEGLARNYEGVGLGLSIVKKFVGLLNGSIEVKSEYLKGSSFCVKIPIEQI
ncbi:MAG TPA: PAS domain-containing sensor histidine kinase [Ignavibacteria bacterium]|nr:PAS domain-containing sensor histidine kinase [Ignavibacteria bacterium]